MANENRLWKALSVFLKYGFKKASMNDVAREIGISRQALYNQYKTKKALFDSLVKLVIVSAKEEAETALSLTNIPIQDRVLKAMDLWAGQFIDDLRNYPHGTEVISLCETGSVGDECHNEFLTMLEKTFTEEKIIPHSGSIQDLTNTFSYIMKGLLFSAKNRVEFNESMERAVRALLGEKNNSKTC